MRKLKALLQNNLIQNILGLSGVQAATMLVPLVTIPYLTRVLGPSSWGLLAFAQAFGGYLMLVIEYGFSLSATREVARFRENSEKVREIISGVLGAKVMLSAACLLAALIALRWVPYFHEHPILLWAALCWAICQGLTMVWYFQGIERILPVAALDMITKILAAVGIFVFVHHPGDAWKVLVLQAAGAFVSAAVAMGIAYSKNPFSFPTLTSSWHVLRLGWTMFFYKSSVSLYTVGNAFILGLFASTSTVGYYAAAEKLSRAAVALLYPINQAVYPRVVHLIHRAPLAAVRLVKRTLALLGIASCCGGVLLFALSPWIVRIIFGKSYHPAVPILEVLAFLPVVVSVNCVFGMQWMLPLGMDRAFNTIVLTAGLLNLGLAVLLAPTFSGQGMAWAVVASELYVAIAMYYWLSRQKKDPFRYVKELEKQEG